MEKRKLTGKELNRAEVPRLYWKASIDRIPDKYEYKKYIENYMSKLDKLKNMNLTAGLYLWSESTGTGKTSIAVAILKEMMRYRNTALFITTNQYKEVLTNNDMFEADITYEDRAKRVDCLVVDNLGREYKTKSGYVENKLEELLAYRIQNMKMTIVTTTLEPGELVVEYSVEFASLCQEGFVDIEIDGHNWRLEKEKKIDNLIKGGSEQ